MGSAPYTSAAQRPLLLITGSAAPAPVFVLPAEELVRERRQIVERCLLRPLRTTPLPAAVTLFLGRLRRLVLLRPP